MIADIIITILESLGYVYFLTNYLTKNAKYKIQYGFILFALSLFIQTNPILRLVDDISILFISIIGFIYCYCFFSNDLLEKVFALLYVESMILFSNIFVLFFSCFFMKLTILEIIYDSNVFLFLSIISVVVFISVCYLFSKYKKYSYFTKSSSMIYLLIIYFVIFFSVSSGFTDLVKGKIKDDYIFIPILGLASIFILIYFFYLKLIEESNNMMEHTISVQEIKNAEKSMKIQEELNKENRMIRHDLKNILLLVENNVQEEDKKKLLEEIKQHTFILSTVVTKNSSLNDIINSKILLHRDLHIDWRLYIESDLKSIYNIHLAILLGNLLDNAIENLGKEKVIQIRLREVNEFYNICIMNSIDSPVLQNNMKLVSKKNNKQFHGFGTKSISKIVALYSGNTKYLEKDNDFIVDILIKKPM